jgi:hypothetical protein
MNWKLFGKKRTWPNFRFYYGSWLEGLRNTTKTSVRIAGLRAEILIRDFTEYEAGV